MSPDIKSKMFSLNKTGLDYKLGAVGLVLSLIFYFESPTLKLYALSVLFGVSLSATLGLLIEKVRNSSNIRTIGVLALVIFSLCIIGFMGTFVGIVGGAPNEEFKKNIFTGECKLHTYSTMRDLPWYYQDCSSEKVKNICQEKTSKMIGKESISIHNSTSVKECLENDLISENKYLDIICQEKSLSVAHQDECRERGYNYTWDFD